MNKIDQFIARCDQAMAFSFYALVYFLPISIAFSETFTVLALLCYFVKRGAVFYRDMKASDASGGKLSLAGKISLLLQSYKPVESCLNWPIFFLLVFSLFSVGVSQFRHVSWYGFLGKVLQSAFLFFNFIECMNSKKRMKIFLGVLLVSCSLITVNGFYQHLFGKGFIRGYVYNGRITSSLRAANDFGAYLVMLLPVLFSMSFLAGRESRYKGNDELFAFFSNKKIKIFLAFLFLLALACLGLTYSRGAWLGFAVSFFVFSVSKRKILIFFGLAMVCFLAVFYPRVGDDRIPIHDMTSFLENNNRLNYWLRASKIIKDYPYFGVGLNTYALVAESYSGGWGGYPHNSYLQMAAETGLFGIATFFWILGALYRDSIRAFRRAVNPIHRSILKGFLFGLFGFLIHSFFDTNFYSVQLGSLMWIVMGVIVALAKFDRDVKEA